MPKLAAARINGYQLAEAANNLPGPGGWSCLGSDEQHTLTNHFLADGIEARGSKQGRRKLQNPKPLNCIFGNGPFRLMCSE